MIWINLWIGFSIRPVSQWPSFNPSWRPYCTHRHSQNSTAMYEGFQSTLRRGAAVLANSRGKRISSTQLQKGDTSNFMPIIRALRVKGHQQSAAEYCSELSLFKLNERSLWCFSSRECGLSEAQQSMEAVLYYVIYHCCRAGSLYLENIMI